MVWEDRRDEVVPNRLEVEERRLRKSDSVSQSSSGVGEDERDDVGVRRRVELLELLELELDEEEDDAIEVLDPGRVWSWTGVGEGRDRRRGGTGPIMLGMRDDGAGVGMGWAAHLANGWLAGKVANMLAVWGWRWGSGCGGSRELEMLCFGVGYGRSLLSSSRLISPSSYHPLHSPTHSTLR